MNLLYILNGQYSNVEYLLSSKFNISYDAVENELKIERNEEFVDNFWGANIRDVIAVVGQNGSGKTKLAYSIMDILGSLQENNTNGLDFLVVFENEKEEIEIWFSNKFVDFKLNCEDEKYKKYNISKNRKHNNAQDRIYVFKQFKVAYFTNALSRNDYNISKCNYIYDASVGALMREDYKQSYGMEYITLNKSVVLNYFDNETEKMITFLYNADIDKMDIPFKVPQLLNIKLNNYNENEQYIKKRLRQTLKQVDFDEQLNLSYPKRFWETFNEFIEIYENTWIDELLINLILNLFKDICVPNTSADHRENEIIHFYQMMNTFTPQRALLDKKNTIRQTKFFMEILSEKIDRKYSEHINKYIKFVGWIDENSDFIKKASCRDTKICSIKMKDNGEFVKDLLFYYKQTNFAYPYFSFSFGLSTGEIAFLRLFTHLYEALSIGNLTSYGEEKCTDVLVILDEADLSLHPRWQQKYVDWVTRFTSSCANGKGVQILITTHSPIMLSDFPKSNVLYLQEGKVSSHIDEDKKVSTFGNNIHSLFLNSFFLEDEGTMGAFAEKKINDILKQLKSGEKIVDEDQKIYKIINNIGDELIHNQLLKLYIKNQKREDIIRIADQKGKKIDIDDSISVLRSQVEELRNIIERLEKLRND